VTTSEMKLSSIAPWFGGKRTMAPEIVRQLGSHKYYFEGCCGSMAVLLAKEPSHHETVCDLHGALTNLAWVVQRRDMAVDLFERLQRVLYVDEIFDRSKAWLADFEAVPATADPHLEWAYHYFIASWMGRNGVAGTASVNYHLATRWTAGGGSGPLRFRNASESIPAWCDRLRNVLILREDLFEVLPKIEDAPGTSIYIDPPYLPWSMSGSARYLFDFPAERHAKLAEVARTFKKARIVLSYYDAPQLHELYAGWTFIDCSRHKHLHVQNKRGSTRSAAPEILIINGPAV
jgi:DNA adenine methylase